MKNCIIVHGCPRKEPEEKTYHKHWIPWIKQHLEENGFLVEVPLMPIPWAPNYENFKREFEKCSINENTILIGHSCGCAFLTRWLGETKQKVNKLIFVAPWKIPDKDDKGRRDFYNYQIDESIKERVNKIVMFTADDEAEDGKKSLEIYHESLEGEVVELKEHGHYILGHMGTMEFPELLEIILE